MHVGWGACMFIDTLNWHAAKLAACSAALSLIVMVESHASSPVAARPDLERQVSAPTPASDAVVPAATASPFEERFDHVQLSLFDRIMSAPEYRESTFHAFRHYAPAADAVEGAASTYDPTNAGDRDAGSMQTSSGEIYDPEGWSAAIQIDLRWQFGGVRYGRNYVPTYALVECNGRRAIVKINDVGPLRPGRVIDLNTRAMRYFDPSMQIGVLKDVKVTQLAGTDIAAGPVDDAPMFTVQVAQVPQWPISEPASESAPYLARDLDNHPEFRPLLVLGERIALFGRSKTALRRQAELVE